MTSDEKFDILRKELAKDGVLTAAHVNTLFEAAGVSYRAQTGDLVTKELVNLAYKAFLSHGPVGSAPETPAHGGLPEG